MKQERAVKFDFAVRTFDESSEYGKMWSLESSLLPPGVNQMYKIGRMPVRGKETGERSWRSSFILSDEAKLWKNTFFSIVSAAGKNAALGNGPFCAGLYLFVPFNFDADNRLKMLNDVIQGSVMSNDKLIQRSVQFKTVAGSKEDKRFLYIVAPVENFHSLVSFMGEISKYFEAPDGKLKKELKSGVGEKIENFLSSLGARKKARSM